MNQSMEEHPNMSTHTQPNNAVVNITTKEYFMYANEEDKIQKLTMVTEFSDEIKLLTKLANEHLKERGFEDANLTNECFGECYWNKEKDQILLNIDMNMEPFRYHDYDQVPDWCFEKHNYDELIN